MFKYVLFTALLAFVSAKPNPNPKPLVFEYPVSYEHAAYSAPLAYSYATHYDYHDHFDHSLPYTAFEYEYAPYHYEHFRR